ncbi:hypothetical protein [uncultured Sphingomonas sp.]|uniref:hypothetical protein n=1 Tax=uncultured Sphingomonas sp. TaxID=158754 RepID=UPI0025916CB9|nr:hypothetical protein [uncultured Sphingomonas sp.]
MEKDSGEEERTIAGVKDQAAAALALTLAKLTAVSDVPITRAEVSIGVQKGPPIGVQKGPPSSSSVTGMTGALFVLVAA